MCLHIRTQETNGAAYHLLWLGDSIRSLPETWHIRYGSGILEEATSEDLTVITRVAIEDSNGNPHGYCESCYMRYQSTMSQYIDLLLDD